MYKKIKIQKMINEVKDKYNRTIPDLLLIYNDICYSIENNLTQFRMYTKTINYDLCGENCLFDSFDEINDMLYCKCKLKKISSRVSLYKEVDIKERDIRKCSNFKLEFSISLQVIILSLLFNKLSISDLKALINAKELDIFIDKPPSGTPIISASFAIVINFEYIFSDQVDPFLDFSIRIFIISSRHKV